MSDAAGGYKSSQYIFLDRGLRVGPRGVALVVHQFALQTAPEALHGGVVIAVPFARHGGLRAELLHQLAVIMGAILGSPCPSDESILALAAY